MRDANKGLNGEKLWSLEDVSPERVFPVHFQTKKFMDENILTRLVNWSNKLDETFKKSTIDRAVDAVKNTASAAVKTTKEAIINQMKDVVQP